MLSSGLDVLLAHGAFTAFMAGLIWTVQLVHYPLFPMVASERWPAFHQQHSHRITWIVGPAMAAEAVTAIWITIDRPAGVPATLVWGALGLLAMVHLTTALMSLPVHARITHHLDAGDHRRLVLTNWIRTVGWTARTLIAVLMVRATITHALDHPIVTR